MLSRDTKTREQRILPSIDVIQEQPAGLLLDLVRLLNQWFAGMEKTLCRTDCCRLLIGYPGVTLPTGEFGESYGMVVTALNRNGWSLQCFSTAGNDELVELSFRSEDGSLLMQQSSISGTWYEELEGLYLELTLPDQVAADCMDTLIRADEAHIPSVAFDWSCRSFLESQQLTCSDTTLSFCYAQLDSEDFSPLSGLSFRQKQLLWQQFLRQDACPPEFEWVWSALCNGTLTNRTEWALALYRVMESMGYQIHCTDSEFRLLDGSGQRIYFSVEHRSAAEKVLMKILFPLYR